MRYSNDDNKLTSILNMDNLKDGGIKTEYGLGAVASIVKDQPGYAYEALEILEDFSKLNFRELNERNNTHQRNEKYIIAAMYEVANSIIMVEPKLADKTYGVMMAAEGNNKGYVDTGHPFRKEFMDTYKQPTKERIQEAKERMLNRRAEKQAAIEKYNENKDRKFYTADDLEFNLPTDRSEGMQAIMQFENGWGVSVLDRSINGRKWDATDETYEEIDAGDDDDYEIAVLDKNGHLNFDTDIINDVTHALGKEDLNKILKKVQKLDVNGKLPPEYSEAENAVSGVVVADEIAKLKIENKVRNSVTPKRGKKLSESIKWQYLKNKKQKS